MTSSLPLTMDDDRNELWLLHDVSRRARRVIDQRAQVLGLTRAQWVAIQIIRRNEGVRQTDLAELMEIEPMTLARLLDRLSAAGWVERRADPNDRRAKRIFFTGDVQGTLDAMSDLILGIRCELTAGFTRAEHEQLIGYLRRLKASVNNLLDPQPDQ